METVTSGMEKVASEGAAPWWFAWLINGAIGGLVAVVGALAAVVKRQDNKTIRDLTERLDVAEQDIKDCTEDREDLRATLAAVQAKIEFLEERFFKDLISGQANKQSEKD